MPPAGFSRRSFHLSAEIEGIVGKTTVAFQIYWDTDPLSAILKDSSGIGRIVREDVRPLKFVSGETTLALYSVVKEMLCISSKPLETPIWGWASLHP